MQALLRQDPANVPDASEAAVEEAAKPAPKSRAKSDTPAETPAPTKEKAAAKSSASEASPAADAKDGVGETVTIDTSDRAAVKNYFSAAIDNLGPQLVQEVMAEHGAQKFGDIDPSKYGALVIRLSELQEAKRAG